MIYSLGVSTAILNSFPRLTSSIILVILNFHYHFITIPNSADENHIDEIIQMIYIQKHFDFRDKKPTVLIKIIIQHFIKCFYDVLSLKKDINCLDTTIPYIFNYPFPSFEVKNKLF